jgi:hypothetical protein
MVAPFDVTNLVAKLNGPVVALNSLSIARNGARNQPRRNCPVSAGTATPIMAARLATNSDVLCRVAPSSVSPF